MAAESYILLRRGQRTIQIEGRSAVIGRSSQCHVVCNDDGVSRRHCEIVVTEQGVVVRDLGSRHGTFVDGRRIGGETRIDSGAIVALGERGSQYKLGGAQLEGRQVTGTNSTGIGPVTTITGAVGRAHRPHAGAVENPNSTMFDTSARGVVAAPATDRLLLGIIWGLAAGLFVGLIGVLALRLL